MAIPDDPRKLALPKFRHLLGISLLIWLCLLLLLAFATTFDAITWTFTNPLLTPIFYLALFGGMSLWIVRQYRLHHIDLQAILGFWPAQVRWRELIGLWLVLFAFSLGAFQVSFTCRPTLCPASLKQPCKIRSF